MTDEEKRAESGDDSDHSADQTGNTGKRGDTKTGLTLRILVAAYILYLAYGLIQDFDGIVGRDRYLIGAAVIVFVLAGGAILIHAVWKLLRKEYSGGDKES